MMRHTPPPSLSDRALLTLRVALGCALLVACMPSTPADDAPPAAPPTLEPSPPPPRHVVLPRTGLAARLPPDARVEPGPLARGDTIVLPGEIEISVRARHALDRPLDAHVAAVRADRIRRFVAERRRSGRGTDFVYVHALDQLGERRIAVRRMWPSPAGERVCAGDAPDAAGAAAIERVCAALAGER